jgi:uncharacterized protein (TIGR00251 family)
VIQFHVSNDQLLLPVRVTPRGGRDCVLPFAEGDTEVRVKVSAPPEDGKANAAVIQLFAKALDISKSRIAIHSGETSRHKQVRIMLREPSEAGAILARLEQVVEAQCFQMM